MELQYKGLRILSRYYSCQDSEFRSAMETSSVDIDKLLSKNFFLWIQCPKISLRLFKDGADLRMESFSCKQSPHTLLLGANGFTLFTTFLYIFYSKVIMFYQLLLVRVIYFCLLSHILQSTVCFGAVSPHITFIPIKNPSQCMEVRCGQ